MATTTPVRQSTRKTAGKRSFDDAFVDSGTLDTSQLNARVTKKAKTVVRTVRAAGRSFSAPPVGWKPPKGSGQVIYPDVTGLPATDPWMDPAQKGIRLVYPKLDPTGGSTQGLFIPDAAITSSTDVEMHQHFEAITDSMMAYQSSNQITEATGEAAAALAMRRRFPSAKMQWGMHVHSGAGIDQIWKQDATFGKAAIYYIVEAKGIGATLTFKTFGPPDEIKQQMSLGWILDNLVRMSRQDGAEYAIAAEVLKALGLAEKLNSSGGPYYENFGGVSKSYYACSSDPMKKTAGLIGVVITASWTLSGLTPVVSHVEDFGIKLGSSSAIV
jgi:hypothetical protein